MHTAAYSGEVECVRALLQAGSDVNSVNVRCDFEAMECENGWEMRGIK